eukprot:scaffold152243_cov19-Tisochrysis_lutea.AAC.1
MHARIHILAEPEEVSQDMLDRLSAEANLFALASHAYWGIWALIQARCAHPSPCMNTSTCSGRLRPVTGTHFCRAAGS